MATDPGVRLERRWRLVGERRSSPEALPPPLTGWVGGREVHLHLWPPDAREPHPEAVRPSEGPLAGYWCLWRVP